MDEKYIITFNDHTQFKDVSFSGFKNHKLLMLS